MGYFDLIFHLINKNKNAEEVIFFFNQVAWTIITTLGQYSEIILELAKQLSLDVGVCHMNMEEHEFFSARNVETFVQSKPRVVVDSLTNIWG